MEDKKKKRIIQYFAFLVLIAALVGSYLFLDKVLTDKTGNGILQAREMYAQPRNTVDVVFLGSSHIHYDVNTALLWEDYGIASYDYSAAEQPLWITYYYLKEFCKYQDPKLVVLDLYSPARYKEDHHYDYLAENLEGVRFSANKLAMLWNSSEPDRFMDFFPSMGAYHTRWSELDEKDWEYAMTSRSERAAFKGYTPYFYQESQEEPELNQEQSGGITLKSEIYLQKIIDYCKKHKIELFLIVAPYITTDQDELVYNRVHEIADMNGIRFNSTNYYYNIMEMDFDTDFADVSHLNYSGSCKFTEYLGGEIKDMFDIPDRRGLERWESWDRNVEEISKTVQEAGGYTPTP